MAGALSLLLGARVRAVVARCGFATQGVAGPGSTGREPDPDSDWEPEERELQEVESALKRQKKAILFQKIRRQMEPRGAPPRTLTREAMEQIRYLHEEFPESWPVPRLAEGFAVSTDVIRRVLKSFVPVAAAQGHQSELQKFPTSDGEGTRGIGSDGLPSARKLEELRARGLGDQNFSSKVVQRGREFFDDNGNFLYRI
uniref:Neugrin n=1 Tax=Myotis myotis TaxID=51298 RepID=A0A7J7RSM5_MYOMY|nr:neugrin, neurite outgrowth associated [Myotis myotis]